MTLPVLISRVAGGFTAAALVALAAGCGSGPATVPVANGSGPSAPVAAAKPQGCQQEYTAWRLGPPHALTQHLAADLPVLHKAANAVDYPATTAALKKLRDDAVALEQYPMPACTDPDGDYRQMLAEMKDTGDDATAGKGPNSVTLAVALINEASVLESKVNAELKAEHVR